MNHEYQPDAAIAKLQDLLKNIKVCFFTTKDADGNVQSRPMQTMRIDGDGSFWFFTNERSDKTREAEDEGMAWLHYASDAENTYVIASGSVAIHDDKETLERYWNPIMKAWYPDGIDTPDLCAIQVKVHEAQYWNGSSSKVVLGFQIAKAIVTGTKAKPGEEGKLHL